MLSFKPRQWTANEYHSNLLAPVGHAVISMERAGIPVDLECLRRIESEMEARCIHLLKELSHWTGGRDINWNSWQQLAYWFHNEPDESDDEGGPGLGMEHSPFCKKGEVPDDKISTDDRALEWLAGHNPDHREHLHHLRQLRQCTRMGRYARDWLSKALPFGDSTFRLHPTFGLASDHDTRAGAVTGRFGVKNPPLNQVPRNPAKDPAGMRAAFVPPPGMRLVVVDYSQLEIVILAHLIALLFSVDDPLVRAVRAGDDIHGPAARYIFGELAGDKSVASATIPDFKRVPALKALRELGKIGIYGKNYGKGPRGFAWTTFLDDGSPLGMERAELLCTGLDEFYPGVPTYQQFIRQHVTDTAQICTLWGRWQPLPGAQSNKQGLRNRAYRQALNYPMQGSGQEIMAFALIAIMADPLLKSLGYVLSLVVHDETVGWAPEDTADQALFRVKEIMTQCVELLAPLKAEGHTGPTWANCK